MRVLSKHVTLQILDGREGKVVTIETNEEEEDLQALTIAAEEDEDMVEDIQPTRSATKLPAYVPPRKGKTKVPKDLGHVPTMKFEDWDLAKYEKFPHLETKNLMKQNNVGVVTTLEPQKWLRRVENVELLNLLWVSHFHHTLITIFVIR